jgi:hypothetical protein
VARLERYDALGRERGERAALRISRSAHARQAGRSLGSSHGIVRRRRSTSRPIFRERVASALGDLA